MAEGATYFYVVRALDQSFNRSGNSNEVSATAAARTVSVTFNVTVPDPGPLSVYIAGTLEPSGRRPARMEPRAAS